MSPTISHGAAAAQVTIATQRSSGFIAGNIMDWRPGVFHNKVGREVHGVRIEYEQRRAGYRRSGFAAHRSGREYQVKQARVKQVKPTSQRFVQVVELPDKGKRGAAATALAVDGGLSL
jgi:hypothetical protein